MGECRVPQDEPGALPEYKIKTIGVESEDLADFQVPTFVNSIDIWLHGQDVNVDMALLTVEQLRSLQPGSEVTVAVHDRFVMESVRLRRLCQARQSHARPTQETGVDTGCHDRSTQGMNDKPLRPEPSHRA